MWEHLMASPFVLAFGSAVIGATLATVQQIELTAAAHSGVRGLHMLPTPLL